MNIMVEKDYIIQKLLTHLLFKNDQFKIFQLEFYETYRMEDKISINFTKFNLKYLLN